MIKQKGFSLIELIIAVTIIGIIASIAIPSYQRNVVKTGQAEGKSELLDVMRSQENYFANNFTYTTDLTHLNYNSVHTTSGDRYSITASTCSGGLDLTQCVLLTAVGIGSQVSDGNLTLNSQGSRTHNGVNGWD